EVALVRQVVDREQRAYRVKPWLLAIELVQIDRHEPGLPVVAMDDVRPQVQQPDHLERRPAEENEAFAVVRIVRSMNAIKAVAVEVPWLIDQKNRHPRAWQRHAVYLPLNERWADRHAQGEARSFQRKLQLPDASVKRQDQRRVMAESFKRPGKRARNIS